MRTSPSLHTPDGMRTGSHDLRQGRLAGTVLAHERHDDGLVHNHAWAVTTNDSGGRAEGGYFDAAAMQAQAGRGMDAAVSMDDRYDDGLVHNHRWAMTAR
ncbi:MAG TPA: hypothetical protein VE690_08165 [Rhodopila sp.]|nr:hypothetical protein [Rhodopila sp.]